MSKKTDAALYAISALLLLACPYVLIRLYYHFLSVSSTTFRLMPRMAFDLIAALLLAVLLAGHIYSYSKTELPRKRRYQFGLSLLLLLFAIFIDRRVIHFPNDFASVAVALFLFVFTLLTALLFGKKQEVSAQPPRQ